MRYTLAFLFILVCLSSSAQYTRAELNDYLNSIPEFKKEKDSLNLTRYYRKIGLSYDNFSANDSAKLYLDSALFLAKAIHHVKAQAAIMNNLADYYSNIGKHEITLNYYDSCLNLFAEVNDSAAISGVYLNWGIELEQMEKPDEAIEKISKAIQIKETTKDSSFLAFYYLKLANLFDHRDSAMYVNKLFHAHALNQSNASKAPFYGSVEIYNQIGDYYFDLQDLNSAVLFYDSMYQCAKQHEFVKGELLSLSKKATILLEQGNYLDSERLNGLATKGIHKINDAHTKYLIYINTAKNYLKAKKFSFALKNCLEAVSLADKLSLPQEKANSRIILSKIYQQQKNYKIALATFQDACSLKDSINKSEHLKIISDIQWKYETEKKDFELKNLTLENEHQNSVKKLYQLLFFSSLPLLILLALFAYYRKILQQREKRIRHQENKINQLENEKLKLDNDEKNRRLTTLALQSNQKNSAIKGLIQELDAKRDQHEIPIHQVISRLQKLNYNQREWETFKQHFEEVHPAFFGNIMNQFPTLTPNELRLCAFLKLNLSSKEIASVLNNTVAAVDKGRNRLRKKMEINSDVNFHHFLSNF